MLLLRCRRTQNPPLLLLIFVLLTSAVAAQSSWFTSTDQDSMSLDVKNNAVVEGLKEHKEELFRMGLGGVAGFATAKVAKSMIKVGALVGCGVYWAIHHGIKLPDAAVKELHLDDAAEAMERKTKGLFDLNGDGEINSEDLTIGKDRLASFVSTHLPLSGGFAAGFLVGI